MIYIRKVFTIFISFAFICDLTINYGYIISMDKALLKTAIFLLCIIVSIMLILPTSSDTKSNHKRIVTSTPSNDNKTDDENEYTHDDEADIEAKTSDSDYVDNNDDSEISDNNSNDGITNDNTNADDKYVYKTIGEIRYRIDSTIPYVTNKDIAPKKDASSSQSKPDASSTASESSDMSSNQSSSSNDGDSSDTSTSEPTSSNESVPSSEPTSSTTISSQASSSEESSAPITIEDNNKTASNISTTHDINIIIARSPSDYILSDKHKYINDEEQIKSCLRAISYFLIYLPRDILYDINIDTIIIVRANNDSFIAVNDKNKLYISAYGYEKSQSLRDSVYRIIAEHFKEKLKTDNVKLNFVKHNPAGFTYGIVDHRYIYDPNKPHTVLYGCFINEQAQTSESNDAAETLFYMISKRYVIEGVPESAKIYPKLIEVKNLAENYYPNTKVLFTSE